MDTPKSSLNAFMNKIIDYAGLYPPASLSLDEAFRNFTKYQDDVEAWMLSRFVIPARRLTELDALMPGREDTLAFTVLGRGGKDAVEFFSSLELDVQDIRSFGVKHGIQVAVDMFEIALPAAVFDERILLNDLVKRTADVLNMNGLTVFFEAPLGIGWQDRANNLFYALRKVKDKHVGFKLRTGGVTADAFLTVEQVAWAIASARDAGVPMKCTAGLHHPVRHFNEGVQTMMHGFLNVFGAGVLALTHPLPQLQIQAILDDQDPASFVFNEDGFSWKGLRIDTMEIERVRHQITSFGSCSFDEPREDLRKIGLL